MLIYAEKGTRAYRNNSYSRSDFYVESAALAYYFSFSLSVKASCSCPSNILGGHQNVWRTSSEIQQDHCAFSEAYPSQPSLGNPLSLQLSWRSRQCAFFCHIQDRDDKLLHPFPVFFTESILFFKQESSVFRLVSVTGCFGDCCKIHVSFSFSVFI